MSSINEIFSQCFPGEMEKSVAIMKERLLDHYYQEMMKEKTAALSNKENMRSKFEQEDEILVQLEKDMTETYKLQEEAEQKVYEYSNKYDDLSAEHLQRTDILMKPYIEECAAIVSKCENEYDERCNLVKELYKN